MPAKKATLKPGSLKALFEKKKKCDRLISEQIALMLKKVNSVSKDGRLYVFFAKRNQIINDLIESGHAFVHLEQGDDVGYYYNCEHQSLYNDLLKLQEVWKGMVKISVTPVDGYTELKIYFSVVGANED